MIFCLTIMAFCLADVLMDKLIPEEIQIKVIKRMCGE